MKSLARFFSVIVLSLSLMNASFAALNGDQLKKEFYLKAQAQMNKPDYWKTISKHPEVEALFKKFPEAKKYGIPKLSIEDDKMSFIIEGEKFLFWIDDKNLIHIESGDKRVELKPTLSLEEMRQAVAKVWMPKKTTSILNLFIDEAHALDPITWACIIVLGALVVWGVLQNYFSFHKDEKSNLEALCKKAGERIDAGDELDDIIENYNSWQSKFIRDCAAKDPKTEECKKQSNLLKCIKEKLNKAGHGARVQNPRINGKDILHDLWYDPNSTLLNSGAGR